MAKKKKRAVKRPVAKKAAAKRVTSRDPLLGTVKGATHRYLGHVRLDVGPAGGRA